MRTRIALAALAAFAAGCGSTSHEASSSPATATTTMAPPAARWPAPSDAMRRTQLAGLTPEPAEELAYHVHAHLDVFVDGRHQVVPAAIGIDITDPAVKMFDEPDGSISYGGISPPCGDPCISPLHTHADDGVLHTESAVTQRNTLGQFFTEWNVRLNSRCIDGFCRPATHVAVYVNGKLYHGDPRAIPLSDREEIAIVIGTPPGTIPSRF